MKLEKLTKLISILHDLRSKPFMHWPNKFQGLVIFTSCFCVIWLTNSVIFANVAQQLTMNKTQIQTKQHQLKTQQEIIKQAQLFQNSEIAKPLDLANLVTQLSTLANKNQVTMSAMKPLVLEKKQDFTVQPLQVTACGHYENVLAFMRHMTTLSPFIFLDDFTLRMQIFGTSANCPLQLTVKINLYIQ